MRQYRDFIFFECAEPPRYMRESAFDFARSEDKDSISREKMGSCAMRICEGEEDQASEEADQCHRDLLHRNLGAKFAKSRKTGSRPSRCHLAALRKFAERAYRRPLSHVEGDDCSPSIAHFASRTASHTKTPFATRRERAAVASLLPIASTRLSPARPRGHFPTTSWRAG